MKTTNNILSALIAAGAPGVALLALRNRIPADLALAVLTAIGLVAFAIFDYTRPVHSLKVRAEVVRPTVPACHPPCPAPVRHAA
jgi:hypothetical protein